MHSPLDDQINLSDVIDRLGCLIRLVVKKMKWTDINLLDRVLEKKIKLEISSLLLEDGKCTSILLPDGNKKEFSIYEFFATA